MRKNSVLLVRRAPRDPRRGILQAGSLRLPCALGRSGTSILKREGDGASPVAEMALLSCWRRGHRAPTVSANLPQRRISAGDGWCDDPLHAAYNRPVRLPFAASAEAMQRVDRLYDFVVVLDWNHSSRRRHRGSAIFLHIARPGFPPTEGCIAVAPLDMGRLSPFLRKGNRLRIVR